MVWCERSSHKEYTCEPEVSDDNGAQLVYSYFINYKSLSHTCELNMLSLCSLNISEGNFLKTVKDTPSLRQ